VKGGVGALEDCGVAVAIGEASLLNSIKFFLSFLVWFFIIVSRLISFCFASCEFT
jgi:hypothetical protein